MSRLQRVNRLFGQALKLDRIPMASFSCPHYDECRDDCLRLRDVCVPGRPGCVLFSNSVFAVPWEERLLAKQQAAAVKQPTTPPDQRTGAE